MTFSRFNKNSYKIKATGTLNKKTLPEYILYSIVFLVFLSVAFTYVYMVFWCFYSGLRTGDDVAVDPFGFSTVNFKNYLDVFTIMRSNGVGFVQMTLNSVYFSLFGCAINIMLTTMLAYVCAKYRFPGSKLIYNVVLVMIMLPLYGTGTAMYKLIYNMGIMNSYLMIITSIGGFNMHFLYLHAFFSGMSWSYGEAAEIDGANEWQIFFRVMFPQSIAMVGSLYVLMWLAEWNSYNNALIYLPKIPTLAVGIYQFRTQMIYESKMNILYAGCFISMIPPLVIFVACNNALMSNVSLGGIKE